MISVPLGTEPPGLATPAKLNAQAGSERSQVHSDAALSHRINVAVIASRQSVHRGPPCWICSQGGCRDCLRVYRKLETYYKKAELSQGTKRTDGQEVRYSCTLLCRAAWKERGEIRHWQDGRSRKSIVVIIFRRHKFQLLFHNLGKVTCLRYCNGYVSPMFRNDQVPVSVTKNVAASQVLGKWGKNSLPAVYRVLCKERRDT